jgi:rare lipoprotein A
MKLTKFVYLTTLFTLGISTLSGTFFPQLSAASTNHRRNLLQKKVSPLVLSNVNNNLRSTENQFQLAQLFSGRASWYGPKFHGRTTANGEIFDSNALTAAHPSLPFGTKVRVTNLYNGRSVIVRINDRGPFVKGRIIDVSAAAARVLNMINSGTASVQLDILGR